MSTQPLSFKNAESCLNLTLAAMRLDKTEDREFLKKAMKTYAALVLQEYLGANEVDQPENDLVRDRVLFGLGA